MRTPHHDMATVEGWRVNLGRQVIRHTPGTAMSTRFGVIAAIATITTGVTAGVYLNFSTRVMPALGRLDGATGIAKMQSFNATAVQPPFMLCFFGSALAAGYFGVRLARGQRDLADVLAAAGGALYLAGLLLTIAYNVPLNDRLAAVEANSSAAQPIWREYLTNWTAANSVRAGLSSLGTLLVAGGAVLSWHQR